MVRELTHGAVSLVRATAADAATLMAWREEPSARRYQPLRRVDVAALADQLAKRAALPLDWTLTGEVQWVIRAPEGPAGWLSLKMVSREHQIADIGYTVAERFRGRGYATAAVRALIPFALDPDGIDVARLQAVAAVDNVASCRVLERAGFRHEGVAQGYLVIDGRRVDHARYGLLRGDVLPREGADR